MFILFCFCFSSIHSLSLVHRCILRCIHWRIHAFHVSIQSDLCRLRLNAAKSYVKLLTDGQMGDTPVVGGTSLRVGAAVQGLGPCFKLKVDVQNGGDVPLTALPVSVT